jgi:osmotically-inducible protein OsmY
MTDDELRCDVAAELSLDPRTADEAIEVSAANGAVTLLGTVGSLRLKHAGGRAAARVRGVTRVVNELRVRIPPADRRTDEDLRGDVLEALMLDVSVPMTVDARARDGFVTLTGTAMWHYQRQAAESRTTEVPGVADIDNAITLTQTPDSRDARDAISAAFRRNAVLDAAVLSVETSSAGLVILSGTASSWAAHDEALAAAWSVPGVIQVDDRIRIESRGSSLTSQGWTPPAMA